MPAIKVHQGCFTGRRVLVTGASGFMGSYVADRLAREGARVGALSRSVGKLAHIEHRNEVLYLPCDLANEDQTRKMVGAFAPELVFHLASRPDAAEEFDHARECVHSNVIGTLHLLDALRGLGSVDVIYGDSTKVYGTTDQSFRQDTPVAPTSSYAISKAAAWQFCQLYSRLYGFHVAAIRPTLTYGPHQSRNLISVVIERLGRGAAAIELDGGTQTRDPLYIDDTIDAFMAAAANVRRISGCVINIGGGQELSVRELTRLIVALCGSPVPVICRPERMRPTEVLRGFCDNREAGELIGWQPKVSLADGLRATIRHMHKETASVYNETVQLPRQAHPSGRPAEEIVISK